MTKTSNPVSSRASRLPLVQNRIIPSKGPRAAVEGIVIMLPAASILTPPAHIVPSSSQDQMQPHQAIAGPQQIQEVCPEPVSGQTFTRCLFASAPRAFTHLVYLLYTMQPGRKRFLDGPRRSKILPVWPIPPVVACVSDIPAAKPKKPSLRIATKRGPFFPEFRRGARANFLWSLRLPLGTLRLATGPAEDIGR